eukprot:TRINITY_DN20028_c0_g1_i1.p1 TRINITY_DN20028_c0_g1~~TRINITY_DN20028_c0_g1_i1.p1  ORF type:complete len:184 (-),score=28.13 TRINITY_DN20028_c0_g1_i1:21-572(-)
MLRQDQGGSNRRWQQVAASQGRAGVGGSQQQHSVEPGEQTQQDMNSWLEMMQSVNIDKRITNAIVMDFLINEGYVEAADAFQAESGYSVNVELKGLEDRNSIRQAVQQGQIDAAIQSLNDFDPEILEKNSELNFHLQQQKLIELIRQNKVLESVQFAQECMAQIMQRQALDVGIFGESQEDWD